MIELILETELGKIVSRYLTQTINDEISPENLLKHVPEIGAIENKVRRLINQLGDYANILQQDISIPTSGMQLTLFAENKQPLRLTNDEQIPIPDNISTSRIERSEHGPLIFWALVALKKSGHDMAIGTEITDIINTYLLDDESKKAHNNVSRALRNKTLQKQRWLKTRNFGPRKKSFGLADNWEDYWFELFGTAPPDIH
jgi:predicted RecB family nuclease